MAIVILALCLLWIYRKRKFSVFSPVDIFIGFYSLALVLSMLYHRYYPWHLKYNFYHFDELSEIQFQTTVYVFIKMILAFAVGVYIYEKYNPKYKPLANTTIPFPDFKKLHINYPLLSRITLLLFVVAIVLVWLDYGTDIIHRHRYLIAKSSLYKTVYQILFLALSFLAALLYHYQKKQSIFYISIILLIALSIGTRSATIYLVLFGATYMVFVPASKRRIFLLVFIPFVLLFFGYNLSLRSEASSHGLIPYMQVLYQKPAAILDHTVENIYYTLIFGFFAAQKTMYYYTFNQWEHLFTTLTPLPGSMTQWGHLSEKLRSNIFAPFTAIGELAKFEPINYIYYIIIGYYYGFIDYKVREGFRLQQYIIPVTQLLFLGMFVILSFEYNLRSSNRYIYYSIGVYLLTHFAIQLSKKIRIRW